MRGTVIEFKNRPNKDGTVSTFIIKDCLIAQSGTPTARNPEVMVHIPKSSKEVVDGAWFDYEGYSYMVIGTTIAMMDANTPTRWDRYCIAKRMI